MPLWPILVDGSCGCGKVNCGAVGKHPRMSQWNALPRMSDAELERLEGLGFFATGYGVRMAGQLLVVDVDARNGGLESMEKLARNVPLAHEAILASGFQVATGSGGGSMHYYFAVPRKLGKMRQALEGYDGIDFKTNGYVVGAGSRHKSGNVYEVDSGSVEGIRPASEALISLLEMPSEGVQWVDDTADILDANMLVSLVDALPNNQASRGDWIEVGMALHHATAGQGVELWQRWSAKYPEKHDEGDCFQKWKTFGKYGKRPITIGSLIVRAKEAGWEVPAPPLLWKRSLPKPATMAVEVEEVGQLVNAPIDVSDVDLTDPPDLAGHLCKWINANSYRKRENLAVAASLMVLSCAGGLTHRCDSGVVGNLMAFCVAESGSGKDNVLNCALQALSEAGLGECLYGGIKSEQETVRNAVSHQLGLYALDEVGSLLRKVNNAQKKGGAAYLEGIMGTLLSITTKGNDVFRLTGDKLAEIKTDLEKRIEALKKPSDPPQAKIDALQAQLDSIRKHGGVVKPFVSVIGFNTPLNFTELVNDESVGTGFLGRSLLFIESDNAPAKRYRVKKEPLNPWVIAKLKQLSNHALNGGRVECLNEEYLSVIHTEPEADKALEMINDYYNDLGFNYDATNSLTPLTNRAHEQVEKVSFVLALGKGRRTLEHVRFAFALVQRDLQTKINLVVANRSGDSTLEGIKAKILTQASSTWVLRGTLRNRVEKGKGKGVAKLSFQKALDELVTEKKLLEKSTERGSKEYKKV
jgi:hypothetical protein